MSKYILDMLNKNRRLFTPEIILAKLAIALRHDRFSYSECQEILYEQIHAYCDGDIDCMVKLANKLDSSPYTNFDLENYIFS